METLPKDKKANPKCKDCYGRGYIRWLTGTKREPAGERLCHCVTNVVERRKKNEDN